MGLSLLLSSAKTARTFPSLAVNATKALMLAKADTDHVRNPPVVAEAMLLGIDDDVDVPLVPGSSGDRDDRRRVLVVQGAVIERCTCNPTACSRSITSNNPREANRTCNKRSTLVMI